MSQFDDRDPTPPNLELSEEELNLLFHVVGGSVIKHGEILQHEGAYPVSPDAPEPQQYVHPLPKQLIKALFYKGDDGAVPIDGEVVYATPFRIEPDDPVITEILSIEYPAFIAGTQIKHRQWLTIWCRNGKYSAVSEAEYSEKGMRLSPKGISPSENPDLERAREILEDIAALDRPLTLDDAEKMRQVVAFLESS